MSHSSPPLPVFPPRAYALFISHAWNHNDYYGRLVRLLNEAAGFRWNNLSVPKEAPLESSPLFSKSYRYLVGQIDQLVKEVDCLLVLAGMYVNHSGWIQSEIEAAREFGKPIIAVEPWGQQRSPEALEQVVTASVRWNTESIIDAIRRHAGPPPSPIQPPGYVRPSLPIPPPAYVPSPPLIQPPADVPSLSRSLQQEFLKNSGTGSASPPTTNLDEVIRQMLPSGKK